MNSYEYILEQSRYILEGSDLCDCTIVVLLNFFSLYIKEVLLAVFKNSQVLKSNDFFFITSTVILTNEKTLHSY